MAIAAGAALVVTDRHAVRPDSARDGQRADGGVPDGQPRAGGPGPRTGPGAWRDERGHTQAPARIHPHYYGAYFRDPDSNKLCVACHEAEPLPLVKMHYLHSVPKSILLIFPIIRAYSSSKSCMTSKEYGFLTNKKEG